MNPASLHYLDLPVDPVPPRRVSMLGAIAASGLPGGLLESEAGGRRELDRLAATLASLPLPAGVVVFSLRQSIFLLEACDRAGLRVPEDVGVLTCGADRREASLSFPPLSTIEADEERIGYLAAGLLRRVRAGEDLAGEVIRVPPAGVSRRLSTDHLGTGDEAVLRALRFMRRCLSEGAAARLPAVARAAGLSPRGLQERFRKVLGRGVSQEWLEMRLERAHARLRERDFESVSRVAAESGFSDSAHLGREMKKRFGRTPREIRREFASPPGGNQA